MRWREFIAGLGSAAAWPVVARAQQVRVRSIGVLLVRDENDPVAGVGLPFFMGIAARAERYSGIPAMRNAAK